MAMSFTPVDDLLLESYIAVSEEETTMCEYFAKCDNVADGVVSNPILGDVPCCQRCADKVGVELILMVLGSVPREHSFKLFKQRNANEEACHLWCIADWLGRL